MCLFEFNRYAQDDATNQRPVATADTYFEEQTWESTGKLYWSCWAYCRQVSWVMIKYLTFCVGNYCSKSSSWIFDLASGYLVSYLLIFLKLCIKLEILRLLNYLIKEMLKQLPLIANGSVLQFVALFENFLHDWRGNSLYSLSEVQSMFLQENGWESALNCLNC